MEGHRYADDEPSWYPGQAGAHQSGNPYDSGIHERPSGAFRLPEQRPAANPYALTDPLASTGGHARPIDESVRIPVRGPEYPTIRPTAEPADAPQPPPAPIPASMQPMQPMPSVPMAEPTSLVPPVVPRPEGVYQSRRPLSSFVVAIVMVVLLIPVVRLLLSQTFAGDPTVRGIVPAVLLALGFTLTGIGLFTVARGGTIARETWLRPPVAYLPVGLILLLAAGLAVA